MTPLSKFKDSNSPLRFYSKDELTTMATELAKLPPVPVVRCRIGHIPGARITPSNPEDFRRVTHVTQFEQQGGTRLMSDGTIVLNIPKLQLELGKQGLTRFFSFGNLKERLLQRGGKEEGKDSVRIALPSAPGASGAAAYVPSLAAAAPPSIPPQLPQAHC